MRCIRHLLMLCSMALLAACGGGGGGGGDGGSKLSDGSGTPTGDNVVALAVNGALGFANLPYTTVTLCEPNNGNCTTINNVLVDTGSSGLRVLASAVTGLALQQRANTGSQPLFECAQFADLSHAWGAVKIADIKIGNLTAPGTNIQTIGAAGATEPAACGNAVDNLDTAQKLGANGILGIGHFLEDCGQFCESVTANTYYYACPGGACSDTLAPAAVQVQNPVARFASDNNGAIVQLPSVPAAGAASVSGWLIFGIDTRSNNALGSAAKFTLNNSGSISTRFNNIDYSQSFVDSGSNGLFFPNTLAIPTCASNTDFYCPASTRDLSADISGSSGSSAARSVSFSVANADQLNANFYAFSNLAGVFSNGFDWGVPFFFGRKVYTALETNAGGPYIAF